MKAPAFLLYTGDFLSSPGVQLMEAHEVGAYCLLLFNSWQSDRPGFLPNDEDRLRRIARLTPAQWAPSRALLLGKFPPAADPALRHNPRLVREAAKQAAKRERLAANGRKGGRPENHLLAQNATPAPEPTPNKQLLVPAKQKLLAAKQLPPKTQAIEKAFNFSFNTTSNEVEGGAAAPAPAPSKKKSLPRPSLPDVQAYAAGQYPGSAEAPAEAAAFFDHFESNGRRVGGKTPMADRPAAFRSWMRRPQFQGPASPASPAAPARAKSAPKPHDPARWS